ncbi:IucA/IucC family siderophore biosynthesis protein [Halobacillus fulvus]|nr:IucA/IucC family siderophore biosynthesis protein [Halobacillus fulvus]
MTIPVVSVDRPLLKEEHDCLRFLKECHPSEVQKYENDMEKGRQGILHKLASAILREDIDGCFSQSVPPDRLPPSLSHALIHLKKNRTYKCVVKKDAAVIFPIEAEFAFHRVETADPILLVKPHRVSHVKFASELAGLLFDKEKYPNLSRFQKELDNGTANLTMAYVFDEKWKQDWRKQHQGIRSTMKALALAEDSGLFFEQLVVEGHHLHPGAKTKLGLSTADVFRYSPEFRETFEVRFVAVRKHDLWRTSGGSLVQTHYPKQWKEAVVELEQKGYDPALFDIVPVHEWQFHKSVPSIYHEEIKEGRVVLLEKASLEVKATSSFRTVSPVGSHAPVLKLAVNSQMTSTVRSISPQTAMNSTEYSRLFAKIMKVEPHLTHFRPLNEIGGLAFRSDDHLKRRNLTMLLREDVQEYLEEGETAVAGTSLYAESPFGGQTILQELVDEYASYHQSGKREAAKGFFNTYIRTVLPGYLTLMVKYGIALEGHLQNSIPVFKNGELTRFFFRDWGGSRVYPARLLGQGFTADFMEGSVSVTDQRSELHNKLYYTVFQNHLGELVRQLVKHTGEQENMYWQMVKRECNRVMNQLEKEVPEQAREDRRFLFQPTVMHKSLAYMRLTGSQSYGYNEVNNPLAPEV